MSDVATSRFSYEGCGKSYALKPELSGRRVKCKCGHVMTVPQAPPPEAELRLDDDLYDVAPEAPKPQQAKARVPLAPVARRVPLRPVETSAPAAPAMGMQAAGVAVPVPGGIPLAYQKGPTQRERERMSNDTLMDMK